MIRTRLVADNADCRNGALLPGRNGTSIFEQMDNIYKKYGYYKEEVVSVTLEGIEGLCKDKSQQWIG